MNKSVTLKKIDYIIFAIVVLGCLLAFQGFHINTVLTGIFYLASGVVIYKIAAEMGMEEQKAKLCAYAAVSMPIGVYCQFVLGQSKIILVFFMLLGFYFWLREDDKLFLLFFAIAFLFGMPALPVFITLLLLKEKRIKDITWNVVLFLVPTVLKTLVLLRDTAYREEFMDFTSVDIAGAKLAVGPLPVNLMLVITLFVALYSYTKEIAERDERVKWALYLISLQMFALFGLGAWEPQWLIVMVPFLTLSAFIHRDTKIFMVLDLALMLFFVLYVVNAFEGIADDALLKNGMFGYKLTEGVVNRIQVKDVLIVQDKGMALSFFAALMIVVSVFKHPKYCLSDIRIDVEKGTLGAMRIRLLGGIAIFLLPALLCFVVALKPPYVTMYTPERYADIGPMVTNRQNSEVFIATKGELESVEFCIGTYDRETDVDITVRIVDATNENILFEHVVSAEGYENYEWIYVDTNELQLEVGGTYRMDVVCYDADEGNYITLYRAKNLNEQMHGYALIDGARQEYHLCVRIIEDELPH